MSVGTGRTGEKAIISHVYHIYPAHFAHFTNEFGGGASVAINKMNRLDWCFSDLLAESFNTYNKNKYK